jgi:hypothetical protein
MPEELTPDQSRLLVLLSRITSPARGKGERERWIKKLPLMALIHRGITLKVFGTYDFAPMLVEYMGTTRYASISKEGEDDVADLREAGLVERLKLATSHYVYVSAYRITEKGARRAQEQPDAHRRAVDALTGCKTCGGAMEVESREEAPYIVCRECHTSERVDIFDIEDVPYVSEPLFPDIWLPPE